jgi:NAD-dependent deacetylase
MPEEALRKSQAAAESCDLFLAVGSSLVVYPAAALPLLAKRSGARLVIVNRTSTSLDDAADAVIHGEIGHILPQIVMQ